MSGGSMNYICFKLEEVIDHIDDKEIKDLVQDLADLLHDLEWWQSGDYGSTEYYESLDKFKDKWFGDKRNERLREYLKTTLNDMEWEIEKLL